MISYKKITTQLTEIHFNSERCGYVERIGEMYAIEVYYMPLNLPITQKHLIKGTIERIVKAHHKRQYRLMVMRHELRNSKMYGPKYVAFEILD